MNELTYYLESIKKYKLLTKSEEAELLDLIEQGNSEAREKFINANLRLVVSVAKDYFSKEIEPIDLVQQGNIGLIYAIDNYDRTKSNFSTYAVICIKKFIINYIVNQKKLIRQPQWQQEVNRKINFLGDELNREPTLDDLSSALNLNERQVELIKNGNNIRLVSIDIPTADGCTLSDTIPDESERPLNNKKLKDAVNIALDYLSPEDKEFMEKIFGLNGRREYTLQEIANEKGCTRQSIHQQKIRILNKLRYPDVLDKIRKELK